MVSLTKRSRSSRPSQVEVDEHREVARRQAVAVPARLERAAATEELDHRQLDAHRRVGHTDLHDGAREVACVEGLLEHLGAADRFDADIGAVAVGERADRFDRIGAARVHGVRRAELAGPRELPVVDVDADDRVGAREARARDGGVAHTTAAEHRDGVAAPDVAGVHRGAEAGHHTAAEQSGDLGPRPRIDLGGLARGDQRLLGERADAERGGERRAVGERHLLGRVVGGEAVPGPTAPAGAAVAAHRAPVEDHEVAGRDAVDVGADRLDDARGLVAEQEREVVVDRALAVVQVGVAHAAGLHLHPHLARARVGHHDLLHFDRCALAACDHTSDMLFSHAKRSSRTPGPPARGGGRSRRRAALRRARPRARGARGCGRSGCAAGRRPRAAAYGPLPAPEERDDTGTPEVVVAGDDRGAAGRRELREQPRHLDRRPVREPRREVHADQVDGRAVDVELDVQRTPLSARVGEHLADRELADARRRQPAQDRDAGGAPRGGVGLGQLGPGIELHPTERELVQLARRARPRPSAPPRARRRG